MRVACLQLKRKSAQPASGSRDAPTLEQGASCAATFKGLSTKRATLDSFTGQRKWKRDPFGPLKGSLDIPGGLSVVADRLA